MEKDPYFNKTISVPAELQSMLNETPRLVQKQAKAMSLLLCSTFSLIFLNFGVYFYYQKTQIEKTTIETYIDLTQTPIYP